MNLTLQGLSGVLEELDTAFFDIPFENSDFQNKTFVVASQLTPARAYRAIGLRMFSKIRAVKENLFALQLADIDIEEKEYKLAQADTGGFDKRRLVIEIAKDRESRNWINKLLNDALRELDCLYAEFQKFPKYTREQFEAEEAVHFQARLEQQLQAQGNGSVESLMNMQQNAPALADLLANPEQLLAGLTLKKA